MRRRPGCSGGLLLLLPTLKVGVRSSSQANTPSQSALEAPSVIWGRAKDAGHGGAMGGCRACCGMWGCAATAAWQTCMQTPHTTWLREQRQGRATTTFPSSPAGGQSHNVQHPPHLLQQLRGQACLHWRRPLLRHPQHGIEQLCHGGWVLWVGLVRHDQLPRRLGVRQ